MNSFREIVSYIRNYRELSGEMKLLGQSASFNLEDMRARKKTDTVYILGSGSSLNEISKEQWAHIFQHDTISFNFFLVHPILSESRFPTYHFMEFPLKGRENQLELLSRILRDRSPLFKMHGTPFLPRYRRFRETRLDLNYFPQEMHSNVKFVLPHLFHLSDEVKMKRVLRILDQLWRISDSVAFSPFIYHAGSISYTTMFAYIMGYKKIVLLGVDLNNPYYFWDSGNYMFYQECREVRSSVFSGFTTHVTAMSDIVGAWGQMPVDRFLDCANTSIFRTRGVEIYVGNSSSLLASQFPVADI